MNSIVLHAPGDLRAITVPEPAAPGAGEALVRIHRVGICGTDTHAFHGRQPFFSYPRVLGHELGVEVLATGEGVDNVEPGDRCAVEPYLNCGECAACRRGKGNACQSMRVLGVHVDGGMCERLVVPARKLHRSATLAYESLALVEPLAIGAHAVARGQATAGESALIIGAGPIGLAVATFARLAGANVILMDVDSTRLDFARARLGFETTLDAGAPEIDTMIREAGGGRAPELVLDATGHPGSMERSFDFPGHGGRLVFVGLHPGRVSFADPAFHARELTVMGSRNALPEDFTRIIGAMEEGRLEAGPWITHRCGLEEIPRMLEPWSRRESGVLKAMAEGWELA